MFCWKMIQEGLKQVHGKNQIEKSNVGDKVKISGAYVTEFRGELQLNIPKKGRIETIK